MAVKKSSGRGKGGNITIIRKEEIIVAGHHGGAWKVAYADFVTALMAFFLLMWLLNATTEAQRRGLADYFSPALATASGKSGSGKPFGGSSPFADGPSISDRGSIKVMNANSPPTDMEDDGSETLAIRTIHAEGGGPAAQPEAAATQTPTASGTPGAGSGAGPVAQETRRQEEASFSRAAAAIAKTIGIDPALAPFAKQIAIDLTPEGLRIQIRDAEQRPMFVTGGTDPTPQARALLKTIARVLIGMHQTISIAGHTDAAPALTAARDNWELSTQRALAARRILTDAGLPDTRLRDVAGHADRDLLLPATPLAPANRRIAIVLLRSAP